MKRKKTYLVLFEGQITEPHYFSSIAKTYSKELNYSLNEDEIVSKYTSPLELVEDAIQYIKQYDEVWVVFDEDGRYYAKGETDRTKLRGAFELARNAGVRIAYSSVCFEYWISLHFEKHGLYETSCEKVTKEKIITTQPQFCKALNITKADDLKTQKLAKQLYAALKDKTETAIKNAEKRREELDKTEDIDQIYTLKAYTDVHVLVKKLTQTDS